MHAVRYFLLRPIGAGKTTTLRLISGLEKLDAGQIFIAGQDLSRHTPDTLADASSEYAARSTVLIEPNDAVYFDTTGARIR